ncbi:hypothetical protein H0S70_10230 [Chryseobacterium manosquense]|uniref:Cupredoxin domain-containing protein n=1 Tax=Chryseobacterium manosquense TaxID=2754694 RepID=A0A7H1DUS7_9FLAO|nr:hypothetical protein [Chryseobacterium manosquense]QNS40735.1 hypothetical protein H0S70_10230 [Chryseobacterium manosquense]
MKKVLLLLSIFAFSFFFSQITKTYDINSIARKAEVFEPQLKSEKTAVKIINTGTNHTELVVEERDAGHEFPHESIPEMVEFFRRHHR